MEQTVLAKTYELNIGTRRSNRIDPLIDGRRPEVRAELFGIDSALRQVLVDIRD